MSQWLENQQQQQQPKKQNNIDNQNGSRDGNIDLPVPTCNSLSSSSSTTNKDRKEEEEEEEEINRQQFQYTDVTVNLSDCMQCYVRLPRCEVINEEEEEYNHYLDTNTQTTIEQQTQGLSHEDDKEKEVNQGNTSSNQQNETLSYEHLLDWQQLYPEDYYSTDYLFLSPLKRSPSPPPPPSPPSRQDTD